jgi:hypothetical protein
MAMAAAVAHRRGLNAKERNRRRCGEEREIGFQQKAEARHGAECGGEPEIWSAASSETQPKSGSHTRGQEVFDQKPAGQAV